MCRPIIRMGLGCLHESQAVINVRTCMLGSADNGLILCTQQCEACCIIISGVSYDTLYAYEKGTDVYFDEVLYIVKWGDFACSYEGDFALCNPN